MTDCIRDDSTECDCSRCYDDQRAWERDQGWDDRDDGFERDTCCLGADCLNADPYHTAAECFDLEMARELMPCPNADGKP